MLDISDGVTALQTLFGGAPALCSDSLDSNDDGAVDIGDPVYLLAYIFSGGSSPSAPFPGCGSDPTADPLGCDGIPLCP